MSDMVKVGPVPGGTLYFMPDGCSDAGEACQGVCSASAPAPVAAALPAVSAGDGYRLLNVGETIQAGDEVHICGDRWSRFSSFVIDQPLKSTPARRKVEPVPVAFAMGDAVRLKSGAWSGCTGRVVGLCSVHGETSVAVRMDTVSVGMDKLSAVVSPADIEHVSTEWPKWYSCHGNVFRVDSPDVAYSCCDNGKDVLQGPGSAALIMREHCVFTPISETEAKTALKRG